MKTNNLTALVLLSLIPFTPVNAKEKENSFSGAIDSLSSWLGTMET